MEIKLLNEDNSSLEELLENSFHKDVNKIIIKECLENNVRFLCAIENNIVISTIMITTKYNPVRGTKSYYLDYICTKEEYRNQGLAQTLLNKIESLARTEEISKIELDTSYDREEAQRLYEKCGFNKKNAYLYIKEIN